MFNHIADGMTSYQYDINGSNLAPGYRTNATEAWINLLSAFGDQGNVLSCVREGMTPTTWLNNNFAMACHLNMPCAGPEYMSGLDLRGTASVVTLRVEKGATDCISYIFTECESKMDIAAGRQAAVYL
eukprot:jgi/Mesvir1/621/Mv26131-RA.1